MHVAPAHSLLFALVFIVTSFGIFQLFGIDILVGFPRIVTMEYLSSDFDLGVGRHQLGWDFNAVYNLNASGRNGLFK